MVRTRLSLDRERDAAIYSAFNQSSRSLTSIFFLWVNYKGARNMFCMNWQDFPDWVVYNLYTGWVCVNFTSYSCSYFMVVLSWRHCSRSLSNYVSKFISNLFITASGVDFVQISASDISSWSFETPFFIIETIPIIKMKDCLRSPRSSRRLHKYVKLK